MRYYPIRRRRSHLFKGTFFLSIALALSVVFDLHTVVPHHSAPHGTAGHAPTPTTLLTRNTDNPQRSHEPAETSSHPIAITQPAPRARVGQHFALRGESATANGIVEWELLYNGVAIDAGFTHGGRDAPAEFYASMYAPAPGAYTIVVFESHSEQGRYANRVTREVLIH